MNCAASNLHGWVDISEGWGREIRPFCYEEVFHVYDWSEQRDSGALVGEFKTRSAAICFADDWTKRHGRKLSTAKVIPFPVRGGADG